MRIQSISKSNKILTATDVKIFNDDDSENGLVKRISLNLQAGDYATLEIEEYVVHNGAVTNTTGDHGYSTKTRVLCVDNLVIESAGELTTEIKKKLEEDKTMKELIKNQEPFPDSLGQLEF